MKQFLIQSFERIIFAILILIEIVIVIGAIVTMFMGASNGGGFFPGLGILIGGSIYVLLMGGMISLALGIYDNTKRTNELLEQSLASK